MLSVIDLQMTLAQGTSNPTAIQALSLSTQMISVCKVQELLSPHKCDVSRQLSDADACQDQCHRAEQLQTIPSCNETTQTDGEAEPNPIQYPLFTQIE